MENERTNVGKGEKKHTRPTWTYLVRPNNGLNKLGRARYSNIWLRFDGLSSLMRASNGRSVVQWIMIIISYGAVIYIANNNIITFQNMKKLGQIYMRHDN